MFKTIYLMFVVSILNLNLISCGVLNPEISINTNLENIPQIYEKQLSNYFIVDNNNIKFWFYYDNKLNYLNIDYKSINFIIDNTLPIPQLNYKQIGKIHQDDLSINIYLNNTELLYINNYLKNKLY